MKIEYYNEYLQYKNMGIRSEATKAIIKFVDSFENYAEKESWTLEYLPKLYLDCNGRVRNELFEEIVFPVLLNGYNNKKVSLMIWLAKLSDNYYQNEKIWKNYKTSLEIIKECYEIDPDNEEVVDIYLKLVISVIDYSIHEWPCGILWGLDGATKEQCRIILKQIPLYHKLDSDKKFFEYINDYENKVKEYIGRFVNVSRV